MRLPKVPWWTAVAGTGPTWLLLIGDPGFNGHSVGNLFSLSAQTEMNSRQTQGEHVIACRISSVQDFETNLTSNGLIDGGVIYFGHGGRTIYQGDSHLYSSIFIGQNKGFYTNLTAQNVSMLSNSELGSNAAIILNACNAGTRTPDGNPSIAQIVAVQLKVSSVEGYDGFMHFSNLPGNQDPTINGGTQNPSGLPMYMNIDGKPPRKAPISFSGK